MKFEWPIKVGSIETDPGYEVIAVNPIFDAKTMTLSSFSKGRGLGDCGTSEDWVWDGKTFRLALLKMMGQCRAVPLDDWPTLYRAERRNAHAKTCRRRSRCLPSLRRRRAAGEKRPGLRPAECRHRRSRASSSATASTIKKALGEDYRTVIDDPKSDFAWWIFASRDNKQLFAMRHHAGDTIHSYREFEVKFGRHDRKPMKLPVYEFITGKGIKLGMKRKAALAKFGPCFKSTGRRRDRNRSLRDQGRESLDRNPKAANMPQYYAEYEFRNGILIRFKFGHEPV